MSVVLFQEGKSLGNDKEGRMMLLLPLLIMMTTMMMIIMMTTLRKDVTAT